jgi:hypothetical protein
MEGDRSSVVLEDFDVSAGRAFRQEVLRRFRSSVHHPSASLDGCFFLLAVFRRFTFRLTERSVSLALHSILGGAPAGFHVKYESDRHFRFAVASKKVGLFIVSHRRMIARNFDVYFHLWRDGGADWMRERELWQKEEEEQWTVISSKRKKIKGKNSPYHHCKSVRFATKLIQDSPVRKSIPKEVQTKYSMNVSSSNLSRNSSYSFNWLEASSDYSEVSNSRIAFGSFDIPIFIDSPKNQFIGIHVKKGASSSDSSLRNHAPQNLNIFESNSNILACFPKPAVESSAPRSSLLAHNELGAPLVSLNKGLFRSLCIFAKFYCSKGILLI